MSTPPDAGRPMPPAPGTALDLDLTDMAYGGDAVGRLRRQRGLRLGRYQRRDDVGAVDQRQARHRLGHRHHSRDPAHPTAWCPPAPTSAPAAAASGSTSTTPGQVDFKTHILREQLRRFGGVRRAHVGRVLQPAAGMREPWHYRNVAHFQVDPAAASWATSGATAMKWCPLTVCPISDPGINQMLSACKASSTVTHKSPGDLPANIGEADLEAVRRGSPTSTSVRAARASCGRLNP